MHNMEDYEIHEIRPAPYTTQFNWQYTSGRNNNIEYFYSLFSLMNQLLFWNNSKKIITINFYGSTIRIKINGAIDKDNVIIKILGDFKETAGLFPYA